MRLLAFILLLFSALAVAQSEPAMPDRIIDEEKARKDKAGSPADRVLAAPLYPLGLLSRGMQKGLLAAENRGWDKSIAGVSLPDTQQKQGFTPLFGGFDIGSGIAGGVKYWRRDFPVSGLTLEVPARISFNRYRELGLNFVAGQGKKFEFNFGGSYRGRPMDDFYGIGNGTTDLTRTNFNLEERTAYIRPTWHMTRTWSAILQARLSSTSIFHGRDNLLPDTRDAFSPAEVPGLRGGRMFVAGAALQHDSRDTTGFPAGGGFEYAGVSWHQGLGRFNFDYSKYRIDFMRYVPLASDRRVLALRFFGESNIARGGSVVPFFDMPILGGGPTMRGFREFRFFDATAALFSAEYRYKLNGWSAAFLFLDEGQVARRPGDIHWTAMRTSVGAGLRLFTTKAAVVSISYGWSAEGNRIFVVFAPRF